MDDNTQALSSPSPSTDVSGTPARHTLSLLLLPEDVLRAILAAVLGPLDKLHSPLTGARCLALLAQTKQHLRAVTYRYLPVKRSTLGSGFSALISLAIMLYEVALQVLLDLCKRVTVAEYKFQWPGVLWEPNPIDIASPYDARRVSHCLSLSSLTRQPACLCTAADHMPAEVTCAGLKPQQT